MGNNKAVHTKQMLLLSDYDSKVTFTTHALPSIAVDTRQPPFPPPSSYLLPYSPSLQITIHTVELNMRNPTVTLLT